MNFSNAASGSSKRQENGDVGQSTDRPLKKARFPWQVKGKYHLKKDNPEIAQVSELDARIESRTETSNDTKDVSLKEGTTENNLERLGDYLLKQDFETIDSVINTESSLLTPCSSISSEKLAYPTYLSSSQRSNRNQRSSSVGSSSNGNDFSVPMSMVQSQNFTEDQCIARWQARQIVKGFVDNTINRVLDSWMVAPIHSELDNDRILALDVTEFIDHLPGDNDVENEGILMAISAHGLQNTSNSDINDSQTTKSFSYTSMKSDVFPSPITSPIASEDEQELPDNKLTVSDGNNEIDLNWSYTDELKGIKDNAIFSPFRDNTSSSHTYQNDNYQVGMSSESNEDTSPSNHFDFLDAAVSFAIQSKGLTSFGTDYG